MSTYKIGIEEVCYGFVWIEADSEEEATTKAHDMMCTENLIESLSRGHSDFPNNYPTMLKSSDCFVTSVSKEFKQESSEQ
jgi:hypothetical protein